MGPGFINIQVAGNMALPELPGIEANPRDRIDGYITFDFPDKKFSLCSDHGIGTSRHSPA